MKKILITLFLFASFGLSAQVMPNFWSPTSGTDTYTVYIPNFGTISNKIAFVRFTNTNTGAATININSTGATNLKKWDGDSWEDLAAGDLKTNNVYQLSYDNTNTYFRVEGVNLVPVGSGLPSGASNGDYLGYAGGAPVWLPENWIKTSGTSTATGSILIDADADNTYNFGFGGNLFALIDFTSYALNFATINDQIFYSFSGNLGFSTDTGNITFNSAGTFGIISAGGTSITGALTIPSSITMGGNTFSRSGAHSFTATTTGNTNVTFPTSGTLVTNPMITQGDLIYGGASGVQTRLPLDLNGYILTSNGTNPYWQNGAQIMRTAGTQTLGGGALELNGGGTVDIIFSNLDEFELDYILPQADTTVNLLARRNFDGEVVRVDRSTLGGVSVTQMMDSIGNAILAIDTVEQLTVSNIAGTELLTLNNSASPLRKKFDMLWMDASGVAGSWTTLTLGGYSNATITIKFTVTAVKSDGTESYGAGRTATFNKDGSTLTQVGTTTIDYEHETDTGADPQFAVGVNSNLVEVTFDSGDADTYRWTIWAEVTITEI